MTMSDKRHRSRAKQGLRPLSRIQGGNEDQHRRTMRSTSPSSWLCKYTVVFVLFLFTLVRLPQSVSAQRPRRMHLRQQRQLDDLDKPELVQPTACIETESELLNAIGDYYGSEAANISDSSAALIYGWPIEDWCLSSDVVKTFNSDSNSSLTDSVADAVDDETFALVTSEDLIIEWSSSVSRTLCTTVCPDTNGEEEGESPPEQPLEQHDDQKLLGDSTLEQTLEQQEDQTLFGDSPLEPPLEQLEDQTQFGDSALEQPLEQQDPTLFGDSPLELPLEQQEDQILLNNSTAEQPLEQEDQTLFGDSPLEQPLEQQGDQILLNNSTAEQPLEQQEDQTLFGDSPLEQPPEQQDNQTLFGDSTLEQQDETTFLDFLDNSLEQPPEQPEEQTLFGDSTLEQPIDQQGDQTVFGDSTLEQEDEALDLDNSLEQPPEQQGDQTLFGDSTLEQPIEQQGDQTLFGDSTSEDDDALVLDNSLQEDDALFLDDSLEQEDDDDLFFDNSLQEDDALFLDDSLEQPPEQQEDQTMSSELILQEDDQIQFWDDEIPQQPPEQQEDQSLFGNSASEPFAGATDTTNNQESVDSGSPSSGSKNETTMSMLIRLIPIKLVCILALTCLVFGVRQMSLSAEGDSGYCCCCKLGCYLFGFGSGGYTSYDGIDPSDISDHQKVVEFEILQLEADGDPDSEIDVVIM